MTDRPAAHRRYVLCSTPAQGHTAPLLALARRLVAEGHDVVFFTTAHYRGRSRAPAPRSSRSTRQDDAHDLMVVNPERESSSRRGVRGVKDDLRRIFIGPLPGQYHDLRAILGPDAADCIVVDSMFFGALPLALGQRHGPPRAGLRRRHALSLVQPRHRSLRGRLPARHGSAAPGAQRGDELGSPSTARWRTSSASPASRLAEAGAAGFPGYFIDLQPKVVDAYLQATVAGFEYPRSDLAPSVRFVGPILAPPSVTFEEPSLVGRARRGARPSSTSPRARSTTRTWGASSC